MEPQSKIIDTITAPIILTEAKDDGFRRAKFLVTTIGKPNRNGRVYDRDFVARETQKLQVGQVLGRDGHPVERYKFTENFLVWESMDVEGMHEYATAKVVPTIPDGQNFIMLAQAGAQATCSRRGYGTMREGTVDGKKVQFVNAENYRLEAIDILNPNEQSDPNARFIVFEQIEIETMNDLTLDALREGRGDIVAEIENAAKQPLEEQVAALETERTALTEQVVVLQETNVQANTRADETDAKLQAVTGELSALTEKFGEVEKAAADAAVQVTALTETVNVLNEKAQAREHLLEKVRGEKAAWLILQDLFDAASVADVDARFDESLAKNTRLIENASTAQHKADYSAEIENPTPETETAKPAVNANLRRVTRAFGLAS